MTSEDDTGQELEDGQEVCPFCNNIVWPGAMQYCDHYLWTRWDGQVIWEIDAASTLIEVASEIFDCLLDAEEEGWLQEALDQADEQFGKLVALARDPTAVSVDDFISPGWVLPGEWRETEGMLSGSGNSEFLSVPAEKWARLRTEHLKKFVRLIMSGKASPFVDHVLFWDRDPVVRTSDGRWFIEGADGWFQTEIKEITSSMDPVWFYDAKDPDGWKKCLHSERDVAEVERLLAKKEAD